VGDTEERLVTLERPPQVPHRFLPLHEYVRASLLCVPYRACDSSLAAQWSTLPLVLAVRRLSGDHPGLDPLRIDRSAWISTVFSASSFSRLTVWSIFDVGNALRWACTCRPTASLYGRRASPIPTAQSLFHYWCRPRLLPPSVLPTNRVFLRPPERRAPLRRERH